MSTSPELLAKGVDLGLPVVQELISKHGADRVSYITDDGVEHDRSVVVAFMQCPDLSFMGRKSPSALRAAIIGAVADHKASH